MPLDILYSVCFLTSTVFFSTPICILIYYSSITYMFMFFSTHLVLTSPLSSCSYNTPNNTPNNTLTYSYTYNQTN